MRGCKKEPRGKNGLSIRANFITLGSSSSPSHAHSPPIPHSPLRVLGFRFFPSRLALLPEVRSRLSLPFSNDFYLALPTPLHRFTLRTSIAFVSTSPALPPRLIIPTPPSFLSLSLFLFFFLVLFLSTFASSRSFSHFVRSLQVCPSFSRSLSSCSFASLTGCFPSVRSSLNLVLSFDRALCRERLPR